MNKKLGIFLLAGLIVFLGQQVYPFAQVCQMSCCKTNLQQKQKEEKAPAKKCCKHKHKKASSQKIQHQNTHSSKSGNDHHSNDHCRCHIGKADPVNKQATPVPSISKVQFHDQVQIHPSLLLNIGSFNKFEFQQYRNIPILTKPSFHLTTILII